MIKIPAGGQFAKNGTRAALKGMSLVELLIAIAIIGVLMQLLLPAVESTREAARRTACQNNLRQIGVATLNHEAALEYLPTAGWGWGWMGDPDRGAGEKQPGSWAYQLLPYMEQQAVYGIGRGTSGGGKYDELAKLAATPAAVLYCPSRRLPRATPNVGPGVKDAVGDLFWFNSKKADALARLDYLACVGDRWVYWHEGPPPEDAEKGEGFLNLVDGEGHATVSLDDVTGVVIQRQPFTLRQIADGTSSTCFAGEKPLLFEAYKAGWSINDDQSCWSGDDLDTVGSTEFPPRQDISTEDLPDWIVRAGFGSAHPSGLNMAMCDGSVQGVSYDVAPDVFRLLGNRHDGEVERRPAP